MRKFISLLAVSSFVMLGCAKTPVVNPNVPCPPNAVCADVDFGPLTLTLCGSPGDIAALQAIALKDKADAT